MAENVRVKRFRKRSIRPQEPNGQVSLHITYSIGILTLLTSTVLPGVYISSPSFASAPLNSRVPPVSPHRILQSKTTSNRELNTDLNVKGKEVLKPVDGEVDELAKLDPKLQEALVVEDLLYALLVSRTGKFFKNENLETQV